MPLRSDNTAKNGYYAMLALHDKQQFYGLAPGVSGKRPAVRRRAGRRSASAGERWRSDRERGLPALCVVWHPAVGENWQLAPSGDSPAQRRPLSRRRPLRLRATFNLRVSQGSPLTLALLYEASWQYMDLNPNGRSYRYNDNVYQYQAVRGDFYKLTFAPTFKVGDVLDIRRGRKSASLPPG